MIDPATFPIYFGLHGCKPWVAKDGFVFAEVGEKELKGNCGRTGVYVQDGVITEVSASIFGAINIEQFMGIWELFNREFEPFGVGKVHEVFGCS